MATGFRDFREYHSPEAFFEVFDDFLPYLASNYVVTTVGTGTDTADTDGVGGVLNLTNSAADNDAQFLQGSADGGTTAAEFFSFVSGKKTQFVARAQLSDVVESDFFAGLYVTDTDPVGGLTDGVYFRKSDGDAEIDCVVEAASAETVVASGVTLVNDTYYDFEIYYDGGDTIAFLIDGVRVAGIPFSAAPSTELARSFGAQNGAAAAKTALFDYVGARQQR